jgi:hypothetical protein
MSHNSGRFLLAALVAWAVLMSIGPTLVALVQAVVPLVIVLGVVVAILRLVFFHTRRW